MRAIYDAVGILSALRTGVGVMRSGKEMLRLPVIAPSQGKRLGTVKDLVIDLDRHAVAALLLSEGARQHNEMMLPFRAVRRVGPDAVMVDEGLAEMEAPERARLRSLAEDPIDVVGMKVFTGEGRLLGSVSDVLLNERTGDLVQYQVSGGALRDVVSGRVWVPAGPPTTIGDRFMVVPAGEVSPRRAELEMGPPLVPEAPPPVAEARLADVQRVSAEMVLRQEDLLLGMRAVRTLPDEEPGGVIVFQGETITREIVDRAKAAGKLNQLVQAAGEAVALALAGGPTGEYIRVAVGRLAGRSVRTTEGEVIIAQGDVVTLEVVERAEKAGVIGQLAQAVRTPVQESMDREAYGRVAARSLWDQVSERVGWLIGAR